MSYQWISLPFVNWAICTFPNFFQLLIELRSRYSRRCLFRRHGFGEQKEVIDSAATLLIHTLYYNKHIMWPLFKMFFFLLLSIWRTKKNQAKMDTSMQRALFTSLPLASFFSLFFSFYFPIKATKWQILHRKVPIHQNLLHWDCFIEKKVLPVVHQARLNCKNES